MHPLLRLVLTPMNLKKKPKPQRNYCPSPPPALPQPVQPWPGTGGSCWSGSVPGRWRGDGDTGAQSSVPWAAIPLGATETPVLQTGGAAPPPAPQSSQAVTVTVKGRSDRTRCVHY